MHRYVGLAIVAVALAVVGVSANFAPAGAIGEKFNPRVRWYTWREAIEQSEVSDKRCIMLICLKSGDQFSEIIADAFHNSDEFAKLSTNFLMAGVGDISPEVKADETAAYAPQGKHAARIVFINPQTMQPYPITTPHYSFPYFYWEAASVLENMKLAAAHLAKLEAGEEAGDESADVIAARKEVEEIEAKKRKAEAAAAAAAQEAAAKAAQEKAAQEKAEAERAAQAAAAEASARAAQAEIERQAAAAAAATAAATAQRRAAEEAAREALRNGGSSELWVTIVSYMNVVREMPDCEFVKASCVFTAVVTIAAVMLTNRGSSAETPEAKATPCYVDRNADYEKASITEQEVQKLLASTQYKAWEASEHGQRFQEQNESKERRAQWWAWMLAIVAIYATTWMPFNSGETASLVGKILRYQADSVEFVVSWACLSAVYVALATKQPADGLSGSTAIGVFAYFALLFFTDSVAMGWGFVFLAVAVLFKPFS